MLSLPRQGTGAGEAVLRGIQLPPADPVQCMLGLVVSVSRTVRAGRLLREESAGAGCELIAGIAGGHRPREARSLFATQLRGEALLRTVRAGPADA